MGKALVFLIWKNIRPEQQCRVCFPSAGESGSADTVRDPRGFAVKFYTEEGNWDLTGNNTPIFFIRDALLVSVRNKNVTSSIRKWVACLNTSRVAPVYCAVPILHPHAEAQPPNSHERPWHGVGLLESEAGVSASGTCCPSWTRCWTHIQAKCTEK